MPAAGAFGGEGLGDDVIEERAVVGDEEQRAVVVLQRGFEQLEGFDVEVVGRLIQHQHIRRLGEEAREQQALTSKASSPDYYRQPSDVLRTDQARNAEIEKLLIEKLERWEVLEAKAKAAAAT